MKRLKFMSSETRLRLKQNFFTYSVLIALNPGYIRKVIVSTNFDYTSTVKYKNLIVKRFYPPHVSWREVNKSFYWLK